jgi:hypothetical protein
MIGNQGRNRQRDLVAADLTEGQFGTGTTSPQSTDTALETAVTGTNKTLSVTKADKQIAISHNLTNTEGNGNTLSEYVITMNTGSTLLTRDLIAGTTKNASKNFQTTVLIFFE